MGASTMLSILMTLVERDIRHLPQFRGALLAWYGSNRRDLPWRKTRDPYSIWVSEIMLQQTRVAAVVMRHPEFLRRFPSVQKLSSARESSVLAAWSGLGYYRRARNLHAAARMLVREHGGMLPRDFQVWRTLPGIGRYTAAAIASIAFDQPVAVLDGNVERVLRRLIGGPRSAHESWQAAQLLLDHDRPGDFNQAMMELGATVCVPAAPRCGVCPILRFCCTRGKGASGAAKPRQRTREITYALARRGDSVFLIRRPNDISLMPGMWEFPEVKSLNISDGILFSLRHSITVTDFRVRVVASHSRKKREGRWIRISRLDRLPLTGLAKKILRRADLIQ